jgi:branched-chain amino acid aminotransferase
MTIAYSDGQYVDSNAISLSLTDFGFCRGLAFFETMRVYSGAPFHMADHIERLRQGSAALGLPLPLAGPEIEKIVFQICGENKFPHSVIKFYFTAGEAHSHPYGLAGDYQFKPRLFIIEDEVHPDHPEAPQGLDFYRRGQRLKIVPHERVLPHVKSISYMQAYYAAREAGPEWDDILFTHHEGYVTESSRSNFFCVIDGVLCTPDKNILDGVTRKVVIEIARELGLPVALRRLMPGDLTRATEAFTTGSYAELVPAKQIDNHVLPTTMDGPVFSALRKGFTERIEEMRKKHSAFSIQHSRDSYDSQMLAAGFPPSRE